MKGDDVKSMQDFFMMILISAEATLEWRTQFC